MLGSMVETFWRAARVLFMSAAYLVVGCGGAAPPASEPIVNTALPITFRTPPTATPTPKPVEATPVRSPTQPPLRGFAEFRAYADALLDEIANVLDGIQTALAHSDYEQAFNKSVTLGVRAEFAREWLRSHPPDACFIDAHGGLTALLDALDEFGNAIADIAFEPTNSSLVVYGMSQIQTVSAKRAALFSMVTSTNC